MDKLAVRALPEEDLLEVVNDVRLLGDPQVLAYSEAVVRVEWLEVEHLVPLAYYVLQRNLSQLSLLRGRLLSSGIDLFSLRERIEIISGDGTSYVAPPVIEYWPEEGPLVVDGLHRVWLARELKVQRLSCVTVRNSSYPLVPRPLEWSDVRVVPPGEALAEESKRDYRFDSLDAVPEKYLTKFDITVDNLRYFFYRDLSRLGSLGIRNLDEDMQKEST